MSNGVKTDYNSNDEWWSLVTGAGKTRWVNLRPVDAATGESHMTP
jgi:hypothetical protein